MIELLLYGSITESIFYDSNATKALVKAAGLTVLRCTCAYRKPYLKLNDLLITVILREESAFSQLKNRFFFFKNFQLLIVCRIISA